MMANMHQQARVEPAEDNDDDDALLNA